MSMKDPQNLGDFIGIVVIIVMVGLFLSFV
jgi:hypothetical protein